MSKVNYALDFPLLEGNPSLHYLDNAATTQKPREVLVALDSYYRTYNANPHRGAYDLSSKATELYEHARIGAASFINAPKSENLVFVRNATEAINLVASSYAPLILHAGDEIVLPISEHHANLVPWQVVCQKLGCRLVYLQLDENGRVDEQEIEKKITNRTKLVTFALIGNVLGLRLPAEYIIEKAHAVGAKVLLDCAQSLAHLMLDVQVLDVDFAVFSSHKLFGPMGIGLLYGKTELLEAMPPSLFGGSMIEYVGDDEATYASVPQRFEAGTQDVGGVVGFQAALEYIRKLGYPALMQVEQELTSYALSRLGELPWVTVYGKALTGEPRFPLITFNVEGIHSHDVATILDAEHVSIRSGHHCAQPLMRALGIGAACRASFSLYTTKADIDALIAGLHTARRLFGYAT